MTALTLPLALNADRVWAEQQTETTGGETASLPVVVGGPSESTYSIRVTKQGPERYKLRGKVASKEDHKAVLGLVKASYPSASVSDRIRIGDGAKAELKPGNVSFALKALSYLEPGSSANIDDQGIALAGDAESRALYDEIKSLIEHSRPTGIAVRNGIKQPQTAFSWRAEVGGGKVKLTGAIPDTVDKQEFDEKVRQLFAGQTIVDTTSVAEGAPESWLSAAVHSLQVLSHLSAGSILLADHAVSLVGQVKDEPTLHRIDNMADGYPGGFVVDSKVSMPVTAPTQASVFGMGFASAPVPPSAAPIDFEGASMDESAATQ